MMAVLLIAGIGFLLAGLLGIMFGVPVKEFSFGNTLIVTGAIAACTGMIMLGLWTVVRELRNIARQLGHGLPAGARDGATRSAALSAALGNQARADLGSSFGRDRPAAENAGDAEPVAQSPSPLPWREEAASRDRARSDAPAAPEAGEATPAPKPRRNLLFSSSLRKERERARARTGDPSASDLPAASDAAPPTFEGREAPPATFEDAWPKSARSRAADAPLPRRSGRVPSTFTEASADPTPADRHPPATRNEPPAAQNEDQPPSVTVLKAGVVDGMAYSLYSDGSIEAQMPEGMMRFASIDELRAHLDQRP
jgi:hypothetical protein